MMVMLPVAASTSPTSTASRSEAAMFCAMTVRVLRASSTRNGTRLEVVGHQRDAGRVGRDVRARQAHRDADVGGGERRAVVDAVADHQHVLALAHHLA
jgi:hypothetical protein